MANESLGCNYSSFAYVILQLSEPLDWGKNVRRWLEDE